MSDSANTSVPTGTGSAPSSSGSPSSSGKTTSRDFRASLRGNSPAPSQSSGPDAAELEKPTSTPFVKKAPTATNFEAAGTSDDSEESETSEPEVEASADESGEEVEDDFSWLESLKPHKQLHGLELADIVQALAEGRLPDELHDIIKIKLKNGEEEWESPLSKARKEAMLHHDYTNKLQKFSKERDEFNADRNEFIEMLQTWKTKPDALLAGLERLEFPVLEAAKLLAARHRELEAMTPRERQLFEEKQALEREINKNKYESKRSEQSKAQEQVKLESEKKVDFVSTTGKALFDKAGIPLEPQVWRVFLNKFEIIANSYPPNTAWTQEMIEHAVEATAYDYNQALARREKTQTQVQPKKPTQQFATPAREQIARAGISQNKPPTTRKKDGRTTSADFRKLIGKL